MFELDELVEVYVATVWGENPHTIVIFRRNGKNHVFCSCDKVKGGVL